MGLDDIGKLFALLSTLAGSCGLVEPPPTAPPAPPPPVVAEPAEVDEFWWHNTYSLFEDGSGVNADGVSFCVWHSQAECSPRSASETVPAGAQEEFTRLMYNQAEEVPAIVDCTTDLDCETKNPHVITD